MSKVINKFYGSSFEANKAEIKAIKGLSVLAMVCLHLFCRLEYSELYHPIVFILGRPLCFYFGQLSDFCVMGFAFCSGYAHRIIYKGKVRVFYKSRGVSLLRLLINYWIIVIAFSAISIFLGHGDQMPGSIQRLLGNLLVVKMDYNGAWWYLLTFIFLIATAVPVMEAIGKRPIFSAIVLFIIYTVSYYLRFKCHYTGWFITQGYLYGMTVFEYAIGVYVAQCQGFSITGNIWKELPKTAGYLMIAVTFIVLLIIRGRFIQTLFIAPITGVILIFMLHVIYIETKKLKILETVGKHSTNIWLTHMFFYNDFFGGLVFRAGYPILIFITMIGITIGVSIIEQFIQRPINNLMNKYLRIGGS